MLSHSSVMFMGGNVPTPWKVELTLESVAWVGTKRRHLLGSPNAEGTLCGLLVPHYDIAGHRSVELLEDDSHLPVCSRCMKAAQR